MVNLDIEMITKILLNGWTITIIGGLIVIFVSKKIFKKDKNNSAGIKVDQKLSSDNNITQNVIINNQQTDLKSKENIEDKTKFSTKILFIDDDKGFKKIVKILGKAGWKNIKLISDIKNTDADDIKNTDIFFIDIHGIGKTLSPKDEGLGLASQIKGKYPNKKVIIYSANPKGDRSHPTLQIVDGFLPKNAEPYQFINYIEKFTSNK